MGITFTQFMRPDGRQVEREFACHETLEVRAKALIDKGLRFECEVLMDGTVSLTCEGSNSDEDGPVAIELCKNGPDVPEAITKLVTDAEQSLPIKGEAERGGGMRKSKTKKAKVDMEKCVYCTYPRSVHADGEWENHQLGTRTVETDWESRAIKAERRVEILMKALEESQDLINESILALKEAHDEKV